MNTNKIIVLAAGIAFSGSFAGTAWAHEGRVLDGRYQVFVGFLDEPAFEDTRNGFDFFVSTFDPNPANQRSVNMRDVPTDKLDLKVTAEFLETDDFNARVIASRPLRSPLKQAFGTNNRYRIFFRPTIAGAYGFHIVGSIETADKGHLDVDQRFVCGHGTQNAEGDAFGCVIVLQPVPGNLHDGYKPNKRFRPPAD